MERLAALGVEFRTDFIVGKTATVDELFADGYAAVFVGTGAGLPHLMGIPGENLIGVYTANEFLTRINLMQAYEFPASDTPVRVGKRTIVVGGGNSAMDAARWAKRMGSESIILFRRGRAELRARLEEIEHAEEEGVHFEFLGAPVRLFGDENGVLREMECIRMELGEVDESGRRSPVPIAGSEYRVPVDTLVMAIGQSPNPTVQRATPQLITKRGKIVIDQAGKTSMDNVFAGGDVVRGGATVILAMKDGRAAAAAIDAALQTAKPPAALNGHAPLGAAGHRIVSKIMLTPEIARLEIEAPEIAAHWKAGQFIILRPDSTSERIPLTLVDGDAVRGTIQLVVQALGKTSRQTTALEIGAVIPDLLGPLGLPATIEKVGTVLCVAGGVGTAELLPVARAFREAGNHVVALCRRPLDGPHHLGRGSARGGRRGLLGHRRRLGRVSRQRGRADALVGREERRDAASGTRDRPDPHDARRGGAHARVGREDLRQRQSDHGGRHRHVRWLPPDGGRQGGLRLRRRA